MLNHNVDLEVGIRTLFYLADGHSCGFDQSPGVVDALTDDRWHRELFGADRHEHLDCGTDLGIASADRIGADHDTGGDGVVRLGGELHQEPIRLKSLESRVLSQADDVRYGCRLNIRTASACKTEEEENENGESHQ